MTLWHAELAWIGGIRQELLPGVLLEVEGDRFVSVSSGVEPPPGARRLRGLVLPGLANVHSHAFQRALRGRSQPPGTAVQGDFWSWRQHMYRLAAALEPDTLFELARATYVEMALAGITTVGEFHYLHHRAGGGRYAEPNQMGLELARAAREAGLRLTLLDACYLRGGLDGRALEGAQLRFGDGSAEAWARRVDALEEGPGLRVGAAVHSVRALDGTSMAAVARWAAERAAPLHVHLSEQPSENRECQAATGLTPTALLHRAGVLGPRTTAIHATHLEPEDVALLGRTGTQVCLCPTTERDLADGVGPAAALESAGSPLSVGSDSQAVIDLFEEARAIELDERLVSGVRGHHAPEALLAAITERGAAALGWKAGRLEAGWLADMTVVDLGSLRLAGWRPEDLARQVVYAAAAADVTDVVVGGRQVVSGRGHAGQPDPARALEQAIGRVRGSRES